MLHRRTLPGPCAPGPVPPEWADYLDLQSLADARSLTDEAWAVDDVLDEHLSAMAVRSLHPDPQTRRRLADNRLTNRRKIHARRRQILLGPYAITRAYDIDPTHWPDSLAARRDVLVAVRERTSRFEWLMLRCLARGKHYKWLAVSTRTSPGTLKSVISRCRLRLRRLIPIF